MPRKKRKVKRRDIGPDSKYNSLLVSKFINVMMVNGKKSAAEKTFYKSMDIIKKKMKKEGIEIFEKAIKNIKPDIEVRSRRVGGATYQVPVEVRPDRQQTLAFRWLKTYSRERNEKGMANKLAGEIMDAYNNTGGSIKKKITIFKMAESNKAFAHYRW